MILLILKDQQMLVILFLLLTYDEISQKIGGINITFSIYAIKN